MPLLQFHRHKAPACIWVRGIEHAQPGCWLAFLARRENPSTYAGRTNRSLLTSAKYVIDIIIIEIVVAAKCAVLTCKSQLVLSTL